jgi:adhesin transport system outer membrane protein
MFRMRTGDSGRRRPAARGAALRLAAGFGIVATLAAPAFGQDAARLPVLPAPTGDPLRLDLSSDPILRLSESAIPPEEFRRIVAAAVARHPARLEAIAGTEEAESAVTEAREGLFPSGDLTVDSYRSIAREFSNDPDNIIERSRPEKRTDALLNIRQTVLDFGATSKRIAAASARLRGATAQVESVADQVALNTIANWYDVVAYQSLVAVSEEFASAQDSFRDAINERIRQGASAEGDLAQIESYIARANTRLAQFRRSSAQAEARFTEFTGTAPFAVQPRAPRIGTEPISRDTAVLDARSAPDVRVAEAGADAARQDYRAAKSDLLPAVTAGVDGGSYGVLEGEPDYDVRARLTLRYRFFGGAEPRVAQIGAQARAAEARAQRIREEAERNASIAWSDVQALEEQVAALRENYIASRRTRDVQVERFRVSRGTINDVLDTNESYFETAVGYVLAMSELDAARYVLLSRTGKLLDTLEIEPTSGEGTE